MKKIKILVTLIALFALNNLMYAQSVSRYNLGTAGDVFSKGNLTLDWTLGEIQTETYITSKSMLTQGFQQSNSSTTNVSDVFSDVEIKVYPNPVKNRLNIFIPHKINVKKIQYVITDLTGRQIDANHMTSSISLIDFSTYAQGVYILTLISNKQILKSYQILKN